MLARGIARFGPALALVLATGCFQPFDPFDPEEDDDAYASPDASTGAKPTAEAGIAPPQPGVGTVVPGGLPTQPGTGSVAPGGLPTQPAPSRDPCTALPFTACSSIPGCARVDAFAIDPMLACPTGEIRPSCMKSDFGCGQFFGNLVAVDAKGQTWRVPFSCVPPDLTPASPQPGFPRVASCPSAAAKAACAVHRDPQACVGDPLWQCGAKTAGRYNRMRGCIDLPEGPGKFLGCMAAGSVNDPGPPPRLFRDPTGDIWEVSGASLDAVPTTWTPVDASSVNPGAGWPLPRCYTIH